MGRVEEGAVERSDAGTGDLREGFFPFPFPSFIPMELEPAAPIEHVSVAKSAHLAD
jgi:hypothetical protein